METKATSKVIKDEQLHLRLTADESAIIRKKAQDAGLKVSEYVRRAALNSTVQAQLSPADLDNLRKIGINLNQLTRYTHTQQQLHSEIGDVVASIVKLLETHVH